jgi:RimJ/RimL family protein N-acetyltransferase
MGKYHCLINQEYQIDDYKLVPIRYEDRLDIMRWRNEQIFHLRQEKPLTIADQEIYFSVTIQEIFKLEQPPQILFSFLKDNTCIGYGGLVHINWLNRNAEISFLINTKLENEHFQSLWMIYLKLVERVAFIELNLHKIYTYTYDVRPKLFPVLTSCNYKNEAILEQHVNIDGCYRNVIIHSKFK